MNVLLNNLLKKLKGITSSPIVRILSLSLFSPFINSFNVWKFILLTKDQLGAAFVSEPILKMI